jgi:hypothetical protein
MLAALMTAALMWGGSLPCSPGSTKVAMNCCHPHGHCDEKPGSAKRAPECGLPSGILASAKAPDAPAAMLVAASGESTAITAYPADSFRRTSIKSPGSPPDLNLLHSIFRI